MLDYFKGTYYNYIYGVLYQVCCGSDRRACCWSQMQLQQQLKLPAGSAAVQKVLVRGTPPLQQIGGDVKGLTIIVTGPTR
jgi:hypothetical protein